MFIEGVASAVALRQEGNVYITFLPTLNVLHDNVIMELRVRILLVGPL
jgi:hypothetical protein